jgi:UDP-glucose 4-epimerase
MSSQVAVVGGNGYIGKHLCKALTDSGVDIIRLSAGELHGISLETGLFSADLTFPKGLDTVYYLSQSPRYRKTPEQSTHLLSVNCIAAQQACEAARNAGVRRFIYASTGNVYEPSFLPMAETMSVRRDNWYALSKVMAEDALSLYRPYLDITIARIFGAYGPDQTDKLVPLIANRVASGEEVMLDNNPQDPRDQDGLVVSLMYIDDLVSALIKLKDLNHAATINLAGSQAISIRRLATELARCMDMPSRTKMNTSSRSFNLISDTTLQIERLGTPSISFAEGIRRFCQAKVESSHENLALSK